MKKRGERKGRRRSDILRQKRTVWEKKRRGNRVKDWKLKRSVWWGQGKMMKTGMRGERRQKGMQGQAD